MIRCRCLRQRQSNDKALLSSLGYENLHGRRQVYAHGYPRTYCDGSPRVSGTSGSNSCMVFVYETGTSTLAFIQKARALGFRRARSVLPSCRSNVQARGGLRHGAFGSGEKRSYARRTVDASAARAIIVGWTRLARHDRPALTVLADRPFAPIIARRYGAGTAWSARGRLSNSDGACSPRALTRSKSCSVGTTWVTLRSRSTESTK